MNNKRDASFSVMCNNCKEKLKVGKDIKPSEIKHKKKYVVNGKEIFLTYFECPKCKIRQFVQIDDKNTLSELKEVKKQFRNLSLKRRLGNEIDKEQSDKFKEAREHLAQSRIRLARKYTGTLVHDNETDLNFEMRFDYE